MCVYVRTASDFLRRRCLLIALDGVSWFKTLLIVLLYICTPCTYVCTRPDETRPGLFIFFQCVQYTLVQFTESTHGSVSDVQCNCSSGGLSVQARARLLMCCATRTRTMLLYGYYRTYMPYKTKTTGEIKSGDVG